ncbi:hypothetical protein LEP1GSC107_0700 [Leptospira interrogans serovar Grippotyphosa str. UI 12769]|uniref:Uncharacterized protein n=1 Tax=Leptospira interrogans str. 2006001854 TaxID=1001590 RepID=M6GHG0_LEPIR|nr:hypothetical protein LEP1GSC057_2595 [Leptospira interrogans str. Brem 329]EKR43496.1 hypothetical protein LEP1GSC097_0129 [Leptospira interrogans serovar Grippotyphosa str. UI 08368]EMF71981.1 hypothetical protein LEP1GSC148_2442 [Leptospira interrogans serovar Canicola str. LT1962]EMM84175.1 hypothetical protein LEP1GSC037_3052 [Leptospira interrogans str. 2006001854]EMM91698.1 hypothetical protein LEP1GSC145_3364 [Leptospira interrogans serovar Djasiman str. LT1649]EMN87224.1 hypothetica
MTKISSTQFYRSETVIRKIENRLYNVLLRIFKPDFVLTIF